MALDLTALNEYTDEHKLDLISRSVLGSTTAKLINLQTDIKNSATINILSNTLVAQVGDSCTWNPLGTTTITQETITVDPIMVMDEICVKDLNKFYENKNLRPGSYNDELPFHEQYAQLVSDQVSELNEQLIWQGDKISGSGNLDKADGLIIKIAGLTSSYIDSGNVSAGDITPANAIEYVDNIANKLPVKNTKLKDNTIFMSITNANTYIEAVRNTDSRWVEGVENEANRYKMHGKEIFIQGVEGLEGAGGFMVMSSAANLYLGTDLTSDAENFEIKPHAVNKGASTLYVSWVLGCGIAFADEIVVYPG